eukprot:COSAG01_NODE_8392_length_2803_cov_46.105030_1_plen_100_part_00
MMAHVQDPKKREQAASAAKGPAKRLRTGGNVTAVVGAWYPMAMAMALAAPILLPQQGLFLGLDGLERPPPRFRTLLWLVAGHQQRTPLAQPDLTPVPLT